MHDPPRVLVVDDTASVRELIRVNLALEGFDVRVAVDGQEALDYARENPCDLVISDVNMPRMDGITLVHELRSLPHYRLTPLLLLTTESSQEKKLEDSSNVVSLEEQISSLVNPSTTCSDGGH